VVVRVRERESVAEPEWRPATLEVPESEGVGVREPVRDPVKWISVGVRVGTAVSVPVPVPVMLGVTVPEGERDQLPVTLGVPLGDGLKDTVKEEDRVRE
jgi:hypothetical protein